MKQKNKYFNNYFILNNGGIGLVEAVLAIGFAVILVVALLSLTTLNVQNALNVTEKQKASKESSLVLEKLRQIKDSNFTNFFENFKNCSSGCEFSSSSSYVVIPSCSKIAGDTCFAVNTDAEASIPVTEIKISIVSYYEIAKNNFSSATETIFTNWRSRQ